MVSSTILAFVPLLQMWNGDHMGDGWGWAGWLTMTLTMVLSWGVVAGIVVVLVRSTGQRSTSHGSTPLDIAKGRYARGEITDEEFERMRRTLR